MPVVNGITKGGMFGYSVTWVIKTVPGSGKDFTSRADASNTANSRWPPAWVTPAATEKIVVTLAGA